MTTTKAIRYRRLKRGDRRTKGFQYRYKEARGWTAWMNGDDELVGIRIHGFATDWQWRGPVK